VVADRIVGQALIQVLDPIFDSHLSERSFAYRKRRKQHDAIATIQSDLKLGYYFVVDADIKACFDEICHLVAMSRVKQRVADGRVLDLLESYLRCGVCEDGKVFVPQRGIPQGGVVSPFLMNLVLDVLDKRLESKGLRHVRYADDFVILCRTESEAQQAQILATETLRALKLRIHPNKTRLVDARRNSFAFLGFQLSRNSLQVHPKAIVQFKEKVKRLTRRQQGRNIEAVIADLNPVIRGWARYFGVAHCVGTFMRLDSWVRMRLRAFKFKRKCYNDNWRLPNKRLVRWGFLSLLDCRKTVKPLCLVGETCVRGARGSLS
jgi:group II intron reverse transcriptase/maturase